MTKITEDHEIECGCGAATGEKCAWRGPETETVIVEYMPEYLRASHAAAGNRGSYPANGAIRFRAHFDCADMLVENDGDWTDIIAPEAK